MSTDAGKMTMNLENVPSSSSPPQSVPRTLSMAAGGRDKDHQQEEQHDDDDALAVAPPSTDAYQCSICLDVASLRPVVTSCGHLFCGTCLEQWTGRQKKSCPVCKGSLSQRSTVAISFLPIAAHDDASSSSSAALFQCQLCAHTATAPVLLTSCGHLFCWTCLCLRHRNEGVYSHSCTACGTSFAEDHVIPIYVKGEDGDQHRGDTPTPSGANADLPCRPPAQRRTDDDDGYPMQQNDLPAAPPPPPPPPPPQGEITLGELLQFLGRSNGTTAAMRMMMRLTTLQTSSSSSHSHSHSHSQSEERPNKRLRSN